MAGTPTVAEVVDLVVRLEDDPERRNLLDSFPYELFRVAVGEGLVGQDGMSIFAQVLGDAVNQGLLGFKRQHAGVHLEDAGAPWTEQSFQARSGYYSTLTGQQMAALFRERKKGVKRLTLGLDDKALQEMEALARKTTRPPLGGYVVERSTMSEGYDPENMARQWTRDVFISHASEDKAAIAGPLAVELARRGLSVWYDEYEMVYGDSLRRKIDAGLRSSEIGVVILSRAFFAKGWTNYELDGLVERMMAGEENVIVPVWHEVTADDVREYSASLANLYAARSSSGVSAIADGIERVLTRRDEIRQFAT